MWSEHGFPVLGDFVEHKKGDDCEHCDDGRQATGPDAEAHIRKYYVDWCITGILESIGKWGHMRQFLLKPETSRP